MGEKSEKKGKDVNLKISREYVSVSIISIYLLKFLLLPILFPIIYIFLDEIILMNPIYFFVASLILNLLALFIGIIIASKYIKKRYDSFDINLVITKSTYIFLFFFYVFWIYPSIKESTSIDYTIFIYGLLPSMLAAVVYNNLSRYFLSSKNQEIKKDLKK